MKDVAKGTLFQDNSCVGGDPTSIFREKKRIVSHSAVTLVSTSTGAKTLRRRREEYFPFSRSSVSLAGEPEKKSLLLVNMVDICRRKWHPIWLTPRVHKEKIFIPFDRFSLPLSRSNDAKKELTVAALRACFNIQFFAEQHGKRPMPHRQLRSSQIPILGRQ